MNRLLNIKASALIIGTILLPFAVISQNDSTKQNATPPTPVEIFFGNNRFVSQILLNKKFAENSQFGLLATSYIAADYKNDLNENESMNVALINFEILKGFGVVSGVALNSHWGFRPYSGIQYLYANHQFVVMIIPGFYLTESHNFETIGFIEYLPYLKNDWSLFSRLEGLYNLDIDTKKHERSHIYGRLGLNYKTFGFGFAANYDWYGPFKEYRDNVGIFFRKAF